MFHGVRSNHLAFYQNAMAKGLSEKLFFLAHLPKGAAVLDFGCADGQLVEAAARLRPDLVLAGLDISAEMGAAFQRRNPRAAFFDARAAADTWISSNAAQRPVYLVASSVLHEVHHYGGSEEWDAFWIWARTAGFAGLCVRDFSLTRQDALAQNHSFQNAVRAGLDPILLTSFEHIWGPIETQGQAVHAALKAPWADSWDREGSENYFPIFQEDLLAEITPAFDVTFFHPHPLAFTNQDTERRFGLPLPCSTHLTLVALKRTNP